MPQDLYRNSQLCEMIAEGEVANLLSHFDSDYVMSVIREHLENRFKYSSSIMTKPNIVVSYNMSFRNMENMYPLDAQNIREVEQTSYAEIIDTICKFYNFQYIEPVDNVNLFDLAYFMYECFISKFDDFVSNFFANFIILNKEQLWDALDLAAYKKDKDVTTLYGKKVYEDIKMAVIVSKLNTVLYYLKGFDVELSAFVQSCYDINTSAFLLNHIIGVDFYRMFLATALDEPNVVTDIKLKIHNKLCIQNDVSVFLPQQQTEEEPETTPTINTEEE